MADKVKQPFTFTIWYFKPSGKYYSEGVFNLDCTDCGQPGHPVAYMDDAVQWLKSQTSLPGLTVRWDGPMVLNCEEGHPVLILP